MSILYNIARSLHTQKKVYQEIVTINPETTFKSNEILLLKRIPTYAVHVAGYFGEVLCTLYGIKFERELRNRFVLLGACTPLIDGLFDDLNCDPNHLKALIRQSENNSSVNSIEAVFLQLSAPLIPFIEANSFFAIMIDRMFEAQKMSLEQKNKGLSEEKITHLTYEKGGAGALLFLSLMVSEADEELRDAIFKIGAWVQVCDDVFDIERDRKEGIMTLPIIWNNPLLIKKNVKHLQEEAFKAVMSANLDLLNKIKTIRLLSLYDKIIQIFINKLIQINKFSAKDNFISPIEVPDFSMNIKVILRLILG